MKIINLLIQPVQLLSYGHFRWHDLSCRQLEGFAAFNRPSTISYTPPGQKVTQGLPNFSTQCFWQSSGTRISKWQGWSSRCWNNFLRSCVIFKELKLQPPVFKLQTRSGRSFAVFYFLLNNRQVRFWLGKNKVCSSAETRNILVVYRAKNPDSKINRGC